MRSRAVAVALQCGRCKWHAPRNCRETRKYWLRYSHRSCGSLVEIPHDETLESPWMGFRFAKKTQENLNLLQGAASLESSDDLESSYVSDGSIDVSTATQAALDQAGLLEFMPAEDVRWQVVSKSGVTVRSEPHPEAKEVGRKTSGDVVQGSHVVVEAKGVQYHFLKLDSEPGFLQIDALRRFQVVDIAVGMARSPDLRHRWPSVGSRLRELELDAVQCVLVIDCLVRLGIRDEQLLSKVVDRIETRYFGMKLAHPMEEIQRGSLAEDALAEIRHASQAKSADNFQALVESLPLQHKVKIILMDVFRREKGRLRRKQAEPPPDAKAKWKTMEPIEMELWERRQFEKGRIRVKRIRNVQAQVTKMPPGNKLRAALAMQLLQKLPACTAAELAIIAQVCSLSQKRLLHGDLLDDFHYELAKNVAALDTHEIMLHLLAFVAAFRNIEGAETWRVWRRKLIPAIIRLSRSDTALEMLDQQKGLHAWTAGVESPCLLGSEKQRDGDLELLCSRAHCASHLFTCTATAKHVLLDTDLYDSVTSPLKSVLLQWRQLDIDSSDSLVLPLELVADVLGACASCGVADACEEGFSLPGLVAELFMAQFGKDISERHFQKADYTIADLSTIAHSVSLLLEAIPHSQHSASLVGDVLQLVWEAAKSSLQQSKGHFVLMLLNALVRAGSEELLTSQPFIDAVDEHLAQKLDYNPDLLGSL